MDITLQRRLSTKYSRIPLPEITCGDGWYGLIDRCLSELSADMLDSTAVFLEILAIKERRGQLRIDYEEIPSPEANPGEVELVSSNILHSVQNTETASRFVCEECGSTFNVRVYTRLKVRCDGCAMREMLNCAAEGMIE